MVSITANESIDSSESFESRVNPSRGRPSASNAASLNSCTISSSFVTVTPLDFVDPAQRVLRKRLVVFVERAHARAEITVVVHEQLRAPALLDVVLVIPQPRAPVLARALVMQPAHLHLADLPVRTYSADGLLVARGDAAGEDGVRQPADVANVIPLSRNPIAQNRLQPEPRARLRPLPRAAEVVAVHVDRLARARLLRRA